MAAQIGVYGLGTMGSALALNLVENGIRVAVSNRDEDDIASFVKAAGALADTIEGHATLGDFVAALERPRTVLFMIPSGAPMDAMIDNILPLLEAGDIVVDAGNADFHDTRRRGALLAGRGLHFVGVGVSGGAAGARHGPSMMVGGGAESWEHLSPMFEAIAARYESAPCVAHVGPDGAGHFVKMVHNGIEYGEMQLIAEVYGLMRAGLDLAPRQIGQQFEEWDRGRLRSYLTEITGAVLQCDDPGTGKPIIDVIRDSAGQKGTGRWTVIEALKLAQSASVTEAAVGARVWSGEAETRALAAEALGQQRDAIVTGAKQLEAALFAARILGHAQGFRILSAAAAHFEWPLEMAEIAGVWRAGCIIRSALLNDIVAGFADGPPAGELILAPAMAAQLRDTVPALRAVVSAAVGAGHAVPALAAALGWHDVMRQPHSTASLIQAQRDYFGRHGFDRWDSDGMHHGPWADADPV